MTAGHDTKWWGWGPAERQPELSPEAIALLESEVGALEDTPPVGLDDVALPEARPLPKSVLSVADEGAVLTGHEDRVRHAAAQSYPDLIRLRLGGLAGAPDAVLLPADAEQVARILSACSDEYIAVVPVGGRASDVCGVDPHRCATSRSIAASLCRAWARASEAPMQRPRSAPRA